MPTTWGELFEYYRRVWDLLRTSLNTLPDTEKEKAIEVILNRSRGLIRVAAVAEMVSETLEELAEKPFMATKRLLKRVLDILQYEKALRPETRHRLEFLKGQVDGERLLLIIA